MDSENSWDFIRRAQLARLIDTLGDVLTILRLDPQCKWTDQFEQFLQIARKFADSEFTQAELNELSGELCNALRPHEGAFLSYRPPTSLPTEGLHGTDNFETFARAAYDQALDLRCRPRVDKDDIRAATVNTAVPNRDGNSEPD